MPQFVRVLEQLFGLRLQMLCLVLKDRRKGGEITVHGFNVAAWERLGLSLWIVDVWHLGGFSR